MNDWGTRWWERILGKNWVDRHREKLDDLMVVSTKGAKEKKRELWGGGEPWMLGISLGLRADGLWWWYPQVRNLWCITRDNNNPLAKKIEKGWAVWRHRPNCWDLTFLTICDKEGVKKSVKSRDVINGPPLLKNVWTPILNHPPPILPPPMGKSWLRHWINI